MSRWLTDTTPIVPYTASNGKEVKPVPEWAIKLLRERERALITELRSIWDALGVEHKIPKRRR